MWVRLFGTVETSMTTGKHNWFGKGTDETSCAVPRAIVRQKAESRWARINPQLLTHPPIAWGKHSCCGSGWLILENQVPVKS